MSEVLKLSNFLKDRIWDLLSDNDVKVTLLQLCVYLLETAYYNVFLNNNHLIYAGWTLIVTETSKLIVTYLFTT